MNVLLLNASPKNDGATQEILNIVRAQLPAGSASELVCLGDLRIAGCRGDKSCYETCSCIYDDDMGRLLKKLDDADVIVIAAPSYWGGVPGQFKVFIDRCTPYGNTNPNPAHRRLRGGKKCYAAALRAGTHSSECERIIETIGHWCGHMGVDMAGSMYFCSVGARSDAEKLRGVIAEKASAWFAGA